MNIVSESDSQKLSMGRRFGSGRSESATANRMLKTTICRTCPSATAFATFSGKAWRTTSANVCFTPATPAGCRSGGAWTPTPAWVMLIAARPMRRASVVTTSK